ncbi:MAG: hypothetical protein K2R98_32585 [Gemmataceae bacterium]|nr:hypothetical protein [Gemmataceae bacterium]
MIRIVGNGPLPEPKITIEEVTDPAEIARFRAQDERHRQNSAWLQTHWADVLPQALGKFLAVAGQEAHCADTAEQAWAWAADIHPDDDGAMVRYISTDDTPRIYAHRR